MNSFICREANDSNDVNIPEALFPATAAFSTFLGRCVSY